MNQYQCVIVDDERLARELLEKYIQKIPYLEITAICTNAIDAMQVLQKNNVDLLFLDIQMPNLTGIDFLRSLKDPPATIFTTAYSKFALEGFELSVVDYLLKPIEFDRFFKAISKAVERLEQKNTSEYSEKSIVGNVSDDKNIVVDKTDKNEKYFFIKTDYKLVKINIADVLYIEADQKYIHIYTEKEKYFTLLSLGKILESLPTEQFIRIHRSYVINIEKIDSIEGNIVKINEYKIPISKGQRERFMDRIKEKGLF